jgi:hypothetical protein
LLLLLASQQHQIWRIANTFPVLKILKIFVKTVRILPQFPLERMLLLQFPLERMLLLQFPLEQMLLLQSPLERMLLQSPPGTNPFLKRLALLNRGIILNFLLENRILKS